MPRRGTVSEARIVSMRDPTPLHPRRDELEGRLRYQLSGAKFLDAVAARIGSFLIELAATDPAKLYD
jgi:hypothetical protein